MSENTVRIIAVGDIFLGEHPFTLGHGVTSVVKERGGDFLFSEIKEHLKEGDIILGNLEGIISPKEKNVTGVTSSIFWGEPECALSMKSVGFNCLSLANNHTAQHGIDVLQQTCQLLDMHNIKWTGFNRSTYDLPKPALFEIRGIRVGILAYCETQQYKLDTPILPLINIENIKRDIKLLKENTDIIIISLHWGDEFIDYPSPGQVKIAHEIIDAGANLILGHHSHTIQGIEQYKNGLIAYSLGSFVKDLWRKELRESIILKCELSIGRVEKYDIQPILINSRYQPGIYSGQSSTDFVKRLDLLSKEINLYNMNDFEYLQRDYIRTVKRLARMDKFDIIKHYIRNIFLYNEKMFFENILLILKRRLRKTNI